VKKVLIGAIWCILLQACAPAKTNYTQPQAHALQQVCVDTMMQNTYEYIPYYGWVWRYRAVCVRYEWR
jgi:hypothetical protein